MTAKQIATIISEIGDYKMNQLIPTFRSPIYSSYNGLLYLSRRDYTCKICQYKWYELIISLLWKNGWRRNSSHLTHQMP